MTPADIRDTAIPDDIMAAAYNVCISLDIFTDIANALPIARAIMAERERCANIAKALADECSEVGSHEGRVSAGLIVRAIRAGTKGASNG